MDIYADQDARLDGKPIFWLTRGREYIVKGGIVTPTPQETDHYGPWLQKWEELLNDPKDVVID